MNPTSVVSAEQTATANALLNKVFEAIIDFLYTIVDITINFFSQPAVLGSIAVIAVVMYGYRLFKSKVSLG